MNCSKCGRIVFYDTINTQPSGGGYRCPVRDEQGSTFCPAGGRHNTTDVDHGLNPEPRPVRLDQWSVWAFNPIVDGWTFEFEGTHEQCQRYLGHVTDVVVTRMWDFALCRPANES